jgi:adenosylhomocysteine nucleosidase
MKIIILTAFSAEADSFVQHFTEIKTLTVAKRTCLHTQYHDNDLYIVNTGVGAIAAANTTTALCEILHPDLIFICGAAGGLIVGQHTGDLIVGQTVFDIDQYDLPEIVSGTPFADWLVDPHMQTPLTYSFSTPAALLALCLQTPLPRTRKGIIASSNIFPAPKNKMAQMKSLHCDVIEMESAAVFRAAEHYETPVIAIRAISNCLDADGNDLGTETEAIKMCADRIASLLLECLLKTNQFNDVIN